MTKRKIEASERQLDDLYYIRSAANEPDLKVITGMDGSEYEKEMLTNPKEVAEKLVNNMLFITNNNMLNSAQFYGLIELLKNENVSADDYQAYVEFMNSNIQDVTFVVNNKTNDEIINVELDDQSFTETEQHELTDTASSQTSESSDNDEDELSSLEELDRLFEETAPEAGKEIYNNIEELANLQTQLKERNEEISTCVELIDDLRKEAVDYLKKAKKYDPTSDEFITFKNKSSESRGLLVEAIKERKSLEKEILQISEKIATLKATITDKSTEIRESSIGSGNLTSNSTNSSDNSNTNIPRDSVTEVFDRLYDEAQLAKKHAELSALETKLKECREEIAKFAPKISGIINTKEQYEIAAKSAEKIGSTELSGEYNKIAKFLAACQDKIKESKELSEQIQKTKEQIIKLDSSVQQKR